MDNALLTVAPPEEAPDPFKGHNPTLAEYTKYRETGELPEWVVTEAKEQPRDNEGKFTKASWREEAAYRKAILDGTVAPNDEMDAATWTAARNAQIARGSSGVPAPKPEPEKADVVKPSANPGEFLPQTHPHFDRARQAEDLYLDLVETVKAVPFTISAEFGRHIAELPNSADVLYNLAKNPDRLKELDKMSLAQRTQELAKISKNIGDPETIVTADEWRKMREEQIRRRSER